MTRSQFIANRIREVFLDGKWIANTNFKEQLAGVTREQATQKIDDLNTIAALTFHINYYLAGLLKVFNGGELDMHDKYSFDMPEIKSDADWTKMVNGLLANAEQFANKVEQLPDSL